MPYKKGYKKGYKKYKKREVEYYIYNPHATPGPLKNGDIATIVSIDPGTTNFAVYVCEYNFVTKQKKSLSLHLLNFKNKGETLPMGKAAIELSKHKDLFKKAQYIVIEEQVKMNVKMMKFSHFLIGYFSALFQDKNYLPIVVLINNKLKLRMLDCPYTDKAEYKKWSSIKAQEILDKDEKTFIEFLTGKGKKDDLGDTICQCEAFIKLLCERDDERLIPKNDTEDF